MTPDKLAAAGLRVKPLEWEPHSTTTFGLYRNAIEAFALGLRYRVFFNHPRDDEWRAFYVSHDRKSDAPADTLEAAKAAAQQDHEARILAALEEG